MECELPASVGSVGDSGGEPTARRVLHVDTHPDREGFSEAAPVIDSPYVHLPAHPDVVTVRRGDGRRVWTQPGWIFAATGDGIWTVASDSRLALLGASTGATVREVPCPTRAPRQLLDLGEAGIGAVGFDQFAALDSNGEVKVLDAWPRPLVEFARWDRGLLLVATDDQAVTTYAVEVPATISGSDPAPFCAPWNGSLTK